MSQDINNTAAASKPRRVIKNLRWYVLVLFYSASPLTTSPEIH